MTVNGRTGLVASTVLSASSDTQNSLEGIITSSLQRGSSCYVEENDGIYVLFPGDVQTPNGTTIIAATGGGNWIFQTNSSTTPGGGGYALLPRVVYADAAATGSAETGAPSAPFLTVQNALDYLDTVLSPGESAKIVCAPGFFDETLTATIDYKLVIEGADFSQTELGADGASHAITVNTGGELKFRELDCGQRSANPVSWTFTGGTADLRLVIENCVFDIVDTSGATFARVDVFGTRPSGPNTASGNPKPTIDDVRGGSVTDIYTNNLSVLTRLTGSFISCRDTSLPGAADGISCSSTRVDLFGCTGVNGPLTNFGVTFTGAAGTVNTDNYSNSLISGITNGAANVIDP